MNDNSIVMFCIQISVILAAAVICKKISEKLCYPSVVGELMAGIILGPSALGMLFPDYYNYIFVSNDSCIVGRDMLAKFAQIFFLFVVGLEMNLTFLKQQARNVISVSLFGILVPFLLGTGTVLLFPGIWGSQACSQTVLAIFIGVAISISALPVIARILMDLGILQSKLGTLILSAATINDLCGWVMFSFVLSGFNTNHHASNNVWTTVILVLGFAALIGIVLCLNRQKNIPIVKKILPRNNNYIDIVAIIILMASAITETIGIHAILGAFLLGAVFSLSPKTSNGTFESINKFTNSFFVPIYFVSIGLKTNFFSSFDLALVVLITSIACVGKICGAFIGAKLSKIPFRDSLIVAFAMNARGAMEIILASIAFENKIIDQRLFVALTVMAIITTLISGPIIQKLLPVKMGSNLLSLQDDSIINKVS